MIQSAVREYNRSATLPREREESYEDVHDDDEDVWPPRMPSSARRYQVIADPAERASSISPIRKVKAPSRRPIAINYSAMSAKSPQSVHRYGQQLIAQEPGMREQIIWAREVGAKLHWLVYLGIGILVMIVGWVVLTTIANWWQVTQDDWHYGRPRTYQTDQVVAHNDSAANPSHFIALNLHRHIEVIEFPGGDATHAKMYVGPVLVADGQDLAAVTLSFSDMNGDGKLDMILNVQDGRFVFINADGAFRPLRTGENIHIP